MTRPESGYEVASCFEIFFVHVVLEYGNLNRMRFGPGYMSLFEGSNMAASAGQSCCFECLKHHKVGIFVEKSNSQRLKKSKKFAFRNSQFTRHHNILLSGTINKK